MGSSFWIGTAYLVFGFINQYAAILPLIFSSNNIAGYFVGKKYLKKLVHEIKLDENNMRFI